MMLRLAAAAAAAAGTDDARVDQCGRPAAYEI